MSLFHLPDFKQHEFSWILGPVNFLAASNEQKNLKIQSEENLASGPFESGENLAVISLRSFKISL